MRFPLIILAFILALIIGWLVFEFGFRDGSRETEPGRTSSEIVFSVLTWEGDYFSKDIPGGVQATPTLGAVYTISTEGGDPKPVVPSDKGVDFPSYSPDGCWIYFQSRATGQSAIYRCHPDGTGVNMLTSRGLPGNAVGQEWKDAFGYSLSRDGSKMVYTVSDGSSGHVALANADGSEPRLVAPQLGYTYMAALSPNGDRVVFSGPAASYRLKLVHLPAGNPVDLTPEHPESFVPRFTPDGLTIVFFRRDGDIYSVGADGGNLRRLSQGNGYVEFRLSDNDRHGSSDGPDISPDGGRIAYIAVKDGVPNVCTMNLDGSEQRQVTFRKNRCGRVRWSPDGKQLAFVSFEGPFPQLFVVNAEGGEPRQFTKSQGAVYFINWKPSSSGM